MLRSSNKYGNLSELSKDRDIMFYTSNQQLDLRPSRNLNTYLTQVAPGLKNQSRYS